MNAESFLEVFLTVSRDPIYRLGRWVLRVAMGFYFARIGALMLHLPKLERTRIVNAVKRLYLDRLCVGNRVIHEPVPPKASELTLTQAIADAVDYTCEHHPERALVFVRKLTRYEHGLRRLNLSDEEMAQFTNPTHLIGQSFGWTLLGVVLLPIALYGWLHRLLPILMIHWSIRRFAELQVNKTRVSTTTILAGVISFGLCYAAYITIVHRLFGMPVSLWYALSLPVSGLVAHYYLSGLRRFMLGVRSLLVRLRAPGAARRLFAWRNELIAEIEAARWQVPTVVLTHKP